MDNRVIKIANLTYANEDNNGAVLQAYALKSCVEKLYREEKKDIEYVCIDIQNKHVKTEKLSFSQLIGKCLMFFYIKKIMHRRERFTDFRNKNLNISKTLKDKNDVEQFVKNFDIAICGSDQIWNPYLDCFDWSYFLPFDIPIKISYAASMGRNTRDIPNEILENMDTLLSNFNSISIREKVDMKPFAKLNEKEINVNCDPTFLLDSTEWTNLIKCQGESTGINEKYILFYSVHSIDRDMEFLEKISKTFRLPIVVLDTYTRKEKLMNTKKMYAAGPIEFMDLIKNATLVCTTSFHGTAFSIIFNKPFFCLNVADDGRIPALLEKFGLKQQIITSENIEMIDESVFKLDFSNVNDLIKEEKNKSIRYLKKALGVEG